ncbi:Na+/H+ antiporter NhaC [Maledivibacter halophilus]|uniref:Transporter, NhaC family n=1 Tax=Maledivibacter halophilus TaxID=36842 RepID=A0A1T5ME60_9FIRM|nr:Na+/H+ antiporter NhaC [Maledivibacter halophilus]SKC86373.1 transporter, NhaC family [Maledivibacter halophilus]
MIDKNVKGKPSVMESLLLFLSIVAILIIGIMVLKTDIHVLLILGLCVTCLVSFRYGYKFDDLLKGMQKSVSRAMVAMVIFILIGTIIGSWITAGTVPALIYYGLKFLNPKFFLPLGLIICSLTSLATGTSWGTAGTVGIALMGMGVGLGIPAPAVAGMVVAGAFFGDKMSPISDTTNLSAVSAGADLYDHIKAMAYTTVPSYLISIIIYTFIGFKYASGNGNPEDIQMIQDTLAANFNLNPIVILPMIVLFTLNLKKVPAVPAMIIGTFTGLLVAVIFQGTSLSSALSSLNYGYTNKTGIELVDTLLVRGGIQNMMWTFSLSFIALCLGGVLEEVGYLKALIEGILSRVKSVGALVSMVICTTILGNASMGEIYLGIILNGSLYKEAFKEKGLKPAMLSRLLEEGGTLTGPLIPWTTAGAFMATTLGVSTIKLAPYALLNIINPILSIVLSFMGIFVLWENKKVKKPLSKNKA